MNIGGIDLNLSVSPRISVTDVALRVCGRYWPQAMCEDIESEAAFPVSEAASKLPRDSEEFFVYRDADAAASWDRDGLAPENANTMIHFLFGPKPRKNADRREITIVYDHRDKGEMRKLIDALIRELQATVEDPEG
jgi:hypothetical protein